MPSCSVISQTSRSELQTNYGNYLALDAKWRLLEAYGGPDNGLGSSASLALMALPRGGKQSIATQGQSALCCCSVPSVCTSHNYLRSNIPTCPCLPKMFLIVFPYFHLQALQICLLRRRSNHHLVNHWCSPPMVAPQSSSYSCRHVQSSRVGLYPPPSFFNRRLQQSPRAAL